MEDAKNIYVYWISKILLLESQSFAKRTIPFFILLNLERWEQSFALSAINTL